MTESLTVELANRSYPIYFNGALSKLASTVKELRKNKNNVCVIADAGSLEAHPNFLIQAGFLESEMLVLPSGEKTKSIECLNQSLRFLAKNNLNRDSALFAFGGGVIGDLAGFTAASYLRGIDFYQIPTTLLSMVDSSVGGKTGINLPEGKNLVGAFWQPKAVFIVTELLHTLPMREFSAGMAEVIKYGMLADKSLFCELESSDSIDTQTQSLPSIIRRCCAIKAQVVANDETETAISGGRALLNLGHSFAHAIENVAGYGVYLHGEAVAIGLILATELSVKLGQIQESEISRVRAIIESNALPTTLKEPLLISDLMQALQRDKKNRNGKLRFVSMQAIGKAITSENVDSQMTEMIWARAGAK